MHFLILQDFYGNLLETRNPVTNLGYHVRSPPPPHLSISPSLHFAGFFADKCTSFATSVLAMLDLLMTQLMTVVREERLEKRGIANYIGHITNTITSSMAKCFLIFCPG